MVNNDLLRAAEAEVKRLEAELEQTPAFQRLQAARNLIEVYKGSVQGMFSSSTPRRVPPPMHAYGENDHIDVAPSTKSGRVDAVVAEYLKKKGARATSGELLHVVAKAEIPLSGKVPAKTLSSYLSTSKRFDNVPGYGGYGLTEWNGGRGPGETNRDGGQLSLNN